MTARATQISGEPARDRHARESIARAAVQSGISHETLRQYRTIVRAADGDGVTAEIAAEVLAEVKADRCSVSAAYREVVDDRRVALYLRLPAQLDSDLRAEAARMGTSAQQLAIALIAGWFADDEGGSA